MAQTAIGDIIANAFDDVGDVAKKWISDHVKELTWAGIGAALNTPAGHAFLKELAKLAGTTIATLAKGSAKIVTTTAKEAIKSAIRSKLGTVNLAASKVGKASAVAGASLLAGYSIGSYIGYTVTESNKAMKVARIIWGPVFSAGDALHNIFDTAAAAAKKKFSKTQAQKEATEKYIQNLKSASEHPMTKQGYYVFEYEQEAAKQDMGPAPTNPSAYNAWRKEVEMRKRTNYGKTGVSKTNDVSWYNRGQASKLSAGTLTWSAVKVANNKFTFVLCSKASVAIMMPSKGSNIHSRIKQNMNVLFQALRGKNTGAFSYEEEDVFNYCYALSSLIARIRYLQKIFRLCNKHDVLVDNLHVALTDAVFPSATSGVAYDDYCKNAPNYISRLNSLVEEINTYALPANTLISRWNYIADKGFKDYNGNQAVYCFYAIDIYPRFAVNATRIQLGNIYQTATGTNPIDTALTELETDVHAFRTLGTAATPGTASNVMVKISGDMIKLLGAKPSTFKNVEYFTGNPVQTFEYDVEAIDQLRNAKMFPMNTASTYGDYTTASNIMCVLKTRQTGHYGSEIVNSHWVDGDRIVTTERAIAAIGPENVQLIQFNWIGTAVQDAGDTQQANITCTDFTATILTDILNKYYINGNTAIQTGHIEPFIALGSTPRVSINGNNGATLTATYAQMKAQLDYIPEPDVLQDSSGFQYAGQAIDVDNFAWLNATQFDEMLNVTAYSLTYYFDPEQLNIQGIIG